MKLSRNLIASLYFIATWLCVSSASVLLVGEIVRGLGLGSAICLYFIVTGMQREEIQRERVRAMVGYDKSKQD